MQLLQSCLGRSQLDLIWGIEKLLLVRGCIHRCWVVVGGDLNLSLTLSVHAFVVSGVSSGKWLTSLSHLALGIPSNVCGILPHARTWRDWQFSLYCIGKCLNIRVSWSPSMLRSGNLMSYLIQRLWENRIVSLSGGPWGLRNNLGWVILFVARTHTSPLTKLNRGKVISHIWILDRGVFNLFQISGVLKSQFPICEDPWHCL